MLAAERRNLILREAQEKGRVIVSDLSRMFDVSEETIRRDLEKLDEDGFVTKGYGGAVLNEAGTVDLPFNIRYKTNPSGKAAIALLTEELIDKRDQIFLDASSTTVFISRRLKQRENDRLSVITNSIENAVALAGAGGIEVVLIGGGLRAESMSLMGGRAIEAIGSYHVKKAFLSCGGIDIEHGITDGNDEVVSIKQAVMNAADQVYLAVDSEKFGRVAFSQVCNLSRIDVLITDKKPDDKWLEALEAAGVSCIYP